MNFEYTPDLTSYITKVDQFIRSTILPLQHQNDNNRFFDHRREPSRTQWSNGGVPTDQWESLLLEARTLADKAGFYRFPLPKIYGGSEPHDLNLYMCALRLHMSSHPLYGGGLSLANDLQNEHSIIGNFPDILMLHHWGSPTQQSTYIPARLNNKFRMTFGLTEIHHGSDATHMDTRASPTTLADGSPGYCITGNKKWQSGAHTATHMLCFARTSGRPGSPRGITAFLIPMTTPGVHIDSFQYTLNMPTDHATILLKDVLVPATAILGPLDNGLAIAQTFTHENRIRQAASSCGAAKYCIDRSILYARTRVVFGKPLSTNQAIQFPLVELLTQYEMLRLLILRTACEMDLLHNRHKSNALEDSNTVKTGGGTMPPWVAIERELGHKISMCNFAANRLVTEAADRAIQVHGGMGYSRELPFEHIWRHFRRYRITEGSEEVQIRRVAGEIFGFKGGKEKDKSDDKRDGGIKEGKGDTIDEVASVENLGSVVSKDSKL